MLVRLNNLIINTDNICCISKLKHPDEWEVKFVSGLTRVLVGYEVEKIVEAMDEGDGYIPTRSTVPPHMRFTGLGKEIRESAPSPVEPRAEGE